MLRISRRSSTQSGHVTLWVRQISRLSDSHENQFVADVASLSLGFAAVVKRMFPATSISQERVDPPYTSLPLNLTAATEAVPSGRGIESVAKPSILNVKPSYPQPHNASSTQSLDLTASQIVMKDPKSFPTRASAPQLSPQPPKPDAALTPASVPSSRVSRLFQYSSLAFGVGLGAISEGIKRSTNFSGDPSPSTSLVLSQNNIERIVKRLSRMRGAALKLGQMLSIQDSHMLPKEFEDILLRVQNAANYMPDSQLMKVMNTELGPNWQTTKFASFETTPFAAASIGQVHYATLPPTATSSIPTPVAVKVQYPGVAKSIDSDISYLRTLSLMSSILPRGMYLDNTLRVARMELGWECDYVREAASMSRMRELVDGMRGVYVPRVFGDVSTGRVLACEFVEGVAIGSVDHLEQRKRDEIGARMLKLCLEQLFTFRFMQTDPNWSNFLYNERTDTIHLLDFGAAREFPATFTDPYLRLLKAASKRDRDAAIEYSEKLGFLTGLESETMLNAHLNSLFLLASPFDPERKGVPFDFANQSITHSVRADIPVMLRERLTPPPDESYSLHRSLSGSFLLCSRIGARVDCATLFEEYASRV
ncbi:ABC1 family-domain-containing protein [Chytriomyces sp. MP71]|nr:ABC1 family-domain-containing protein [Chytriomyces sp. MP71]